MDSPLRFESVLFKRGSTSAVVSLVLSRHHLVLVFASPDTFGKKEHWVAYSSIFSIDRHFPTPDGYYPIIINGRNFSTLRLAIGSDQDATDIFTNMQKLMNTSSVDQLFAFFYTPAEKFTSAVGWSYDTEAEFRRMGLGVRTDAWRITTINKDFLFCSTYPQVLAVPAKISDNVLKHAGKFRSKARIPVLSYIHKTNMVTISRCSQPLVGLKQNRSIQDEKLVESIFTTGRAPPVKGQTHLIIDARPSANVMGQTALGAGVESTENYRDCRVCLLGIQNIHVMRDSINKLMEAALSGDNGASLRAGMDRSGWLNHIRTVLDGTLMIVKSVHSFNTHTLVHCSDGWDRTAQLCSLAEICLDPFYRTIEGFQTLVEKEWMSFGHKFRDRLGLLSKPNRDGTGPSVGSQITAASKSMQYSFTSAAKNLLKQGNSSSGRGSPGSSNGHRNFSNVQLAGPQGSVEVIYPNFLASHEVSPVFTQFLDCVYQLWTQFPTHFEFSEKYLLTLNSHLHSSQFGTFLFNNEKERKTFLFKGSNGLNSTGSPVPVNMAAYSVWDYFLSNKAEYVNQLYVAPENRKDKAPVNLDTSGSSPIQIYTDGDVLFPSPESTRYWMGLYAGQTDANTPFGDVTNAPLGEIKPVSAAYVSSICGSSGKPGFQLTVGDLDDEADSNGGSSNASVNSNGASWQSALSNTAAQVSSFATIASTTWSMSGAWMAPQPAAAPVPIDPFVRSSLPKSKSSSVERLNDLPKKSITPPVSAAPSSGRVSVQDRLAKTVERQMSDLNLRSGRGMESQAATIGVVSDDEGKLPSKPFTESLPHPLWSSDE